MKNKKNKSGMTRRERNDKLTNWYMINLSWGVVGILILQFINMGYKNISMLPYMQIIMWVLFGVLAVAGVVVYALGKKGIIKNSSRATNYAIMLGVSALVGLWLALYNKIRVILEEILKVISRNEGFSVTSYWNVYIPMTAIGIYLVIAFIYYIVNIFKK